MHESDRIRIRLALNHLRNCSGCDACQRLREKIETQQRETKRRRIAAEDATGRPASIQAQEDKARYGSDGILRYPTSIPGVEYSHRVIDPSKPERPRSDTSLKEKRDKEEVEEDYRKAQEDYRKAQEIMKQCLQ